MVTEQARSVRPSEVRWHRDLLRFDGGGRVVAANQLLLSAIVVVLFVMGIATSPPARPELFAIGALIIILGAIAALILPWGRIAAPWAALIPILDILAIALLRFADPASGLGLLWAFPAMWLASLGAAGLVVACVLIPALYWGVTALTPGQGFIFATLLLPLVIVAISYASYASSRRHAAQRELLDSQAAHLAFARSAAVRQEQLLTEVLDTVDFGVVRLSVGGDIVYENDGVGRFSSSIPGLHAAAARDALLAADGRTPLALAAHPLERARRGETFEDELVWSEDPSGRRRALTFTARRLVDHRAEDSGAVLVARDVTAARQALSARDDLVASVSHELRTPLTSVIGHLDLVLEDDDLSTQSRRNAETALGSGERLLTIVADILSASRESARSVESSVHPRDVDVAEIVRAALVAIGPVAAERVVKLSCEAPEHVSAFADPSRLRQVVDNLLGNAIKFNRDGGTVHVEVSTDGAQSVVEVRDTGIGIAAEDLPHVFDRFYRASEDVEGSGLGLAISRELVAAHGGRIDVVSEPGVGSTFTVTVPARDPEEAR